MNFFITVPLDTTSTQRARLCDLRAEFARVCNQLAPAVQTSRVWNRVTLHHLYYYALRQQFPHLGSQMICNAIYAVSKTAKLVYQHPKSPYNVLRKGKNSLPLLRFSETCPVYFDRHTMSIKDSQLSLFTMDGRIHFNLTLSAAKSDLFTRAKLREVVLRERVDQRFELLFCLDSGDTKPVNLGSSPSLDKAPSAFQAVPDYVSVESTP